uniref:Uncharacterized protein n=1 Tax=Trypanosoma congolense (strain IL3000) TaxID=1068625 RepID=G0USY3_TRYCI|nr:hypothetical protein, unlikely [Trypanosoma congolense IL3000]
MRERSSSYVSAQMSRDSAQACLFRSAWRGMGKSATRNLLMQSSTCDAIAALVFASSSPTRVNGMSGKASARARSSTVCVTMSAVVTRSFAAVPSLWASWPLTPTVTTCRSRSRSIRKLCGSKSAIRTSRRGASELSSCSSSRMI